MLSPVRLRREQLCLMLFFISYHSPEEGSSGFFYNDSEEFRQAKRDEFEVYPG